MPADFVDSNVLIYLALLDDGRWERASELLDARVTISVQVMNEVAHVLRRKAHADWERIADFLSIVHKNATVRPITLAIHRDGLRLARRYGFAFYDAMIVASALDAGCTTLWSEDMHDGLLVDGRLAIRNPFGSATVIR